MNVNIRTIATLAVAAFLGLVAVIVARSYLVAPVEAPGPVASTGPLVPIVVAAQSVTRGAPLQPSLLKITGYPPNAVPEGAFHSIGELVGPHGQQRLALRSMVENEPILPANVSGPGGKLNLATLLEPGMRAVSLRSNDVAGVGGFVLPGDRVDVLLTRAAGNGEAEGVTQILAEDVRVLGVDQSDNDEADNPVVAKAVTVEVTPEQAESISLGESVGTVSLMLRHVADDAPLTHKTLTVSELNGAPPRPAVVGRAAPGVRVVRGVDATHFTFAVGNSLQRLSTEMPAGVTP